MTAKTSTWASNLPTIILPFSSIYGDSAGNLTAGKFLGKLNNALTITYNGTSVEYDNTQARTLTIYGPTSPGTLGQLAYSTGSGVDWKTPVTTVTSSSTHSQIPTTGGDTQARNTESQ